MNGLARNPELRANADPLGGNRGGAVMNIRGLAAVRAGNGVAPSLSPQSPQAVKGEA